MSDSNLSDIKIHMTDSERELFEKYLKKARFYLEYGCGGSTEAAVRLKVGRIISIESDKGWVETLSNKPELAAAIKEGKLRLIHVDIGEVAKWGAPKDDAMLRNWPDYFLRPFEKFEYEYDTVLVDGRFRIACALACHAFLMDSAIVMIHDYRTRDGYSEVEKYYEIIDNVDNLFVFKKKSKINYRSFYTSVLRSIFKY
jgi:hypothetical protein